MSDQPNFAPWPKGEPVPEGYSIINVKSIEAVAYGPEGASAIILFTSDMQQRLCLAMPVVWLDQVLAQVRSDPAQTRAHLAMHADLGGL